MGNTDDGEPHADVVFMGGAKVGKTTMLHRIMRFETSAALEGKYKPTIEDSYVREFLVGEHRCRLRLVDTAGGYAFPAMQKLWAKRGSAFILVCARDDSSSLEQIRAVMEHIQEQRKDDTRRLLLVLAINKCDLHLKDWTVSDDDVEQLAEEYQIPYSSIVQTSAFNEMGMMKMLQALWRQNEEAGELAIQFEAQSERLSSDRRFSAFAALFGNSYASTSTRSTEANANKTNGAQEFERPHASSFSGTMLPRQRPYQPVASTSPSWLSKTFGKMAVGSKDKHNVKSKQGYPAVIDLQCTVS